MPDWKPYISVARRRAKAQKHAKDLAKKGVKFAPVVIDGRAIAKSFWGKSWCDNLESYSDYANRLPRGRTYVRNGSVIDLRVKKGAVVATVSGSELYSISVAVQGLAPKRWKTLVDEHASQVSSVVNLLRGKLPDSLLKALADRGSGLFPSPKELKFSCSCPDWADMCKHVAAVLYGVGSRLDAQPELFFLLRGVEVTDLAARGVAADFTAPEGGEIAPGDLASIFGIELEDRGSPQAGRRAKPAVKVPKAKTITSVELRERGVSVATAGSWVRAGVLTKTEARGVYGLTPAARARLKKVGRRSRPQADLPPWS